MAEMHFATRFEIKRGYYLNTKIQNKHNTPLPSKRPRSQEAEMEHLELTVKFGETADFM